MNWCGSLFTGSLNHHSRRWIRTSGFAIFLLLLFILCGCGRTGQSLQPHLSEPALRLPASDLASYTQQDPEQVFELALSRTLSANGVQIRQEDQTLQLICREDTMWLIQDYGNTWSFQKQADGETLTFGLLKEGKSWTLSPALYSSQAAHTDMAQYLNDTDWLRMQLKTFLFPGQPDLLFGLPGTWTWQQDQIVCSSGESQFRFSLAENGTLKEENIEAAGQTHVLTFQPLDVPDSYIRWLETLFDSVKDAPAGKTMSLS